MPDPVQQNKSTSIWEKDPWFSTGNTLYGYMTGKQSLAATANGPRHYGIDRLIRIEIRNFAN